MDGIGNKLVPLGGYPKELREKAIEMYKQGYKKVKIAQILGVGRTTVRRWTKTGSHAYFKPHSPELAAIRNVFGLREERYKYLLPYKKKKPKEEERNSRLSQF